jgi:hypothetical protein
MQKFSENLAKLSKPQNWKEKKTLAISSNKLFLCYYDTIYLYGTLWTG